MPKNNKNDGSYKYMYLTTAAICVVVAIMLVFFVMALSRFADHDESSEQVSESSVSETSSEEVSEISEDTSTASGNKYYDSIEYDKVVFRNSDVLSGSLAVIDGKNGYPAVSDSDLVRISSVMTKSTYGLSNTSLKLNAEAMTNFDNFIVSFCTATPNSGLIINVGYVAPENLSGNDEKQKEFTTSYSVKFGIYNSSHKFSDTEFSYLKDQCYKYGIIRRYTDGKEAYTGQSADSTIYRYVGLAHSLYMNYYNYSLEEYLDKIHTDTVVEFTSDLEDNTAYVVYYVPAESGDVTNVPVPADALKYPYDISGDGQGGFIVTVKVNTAN